MDLVLAGDLIFDSQRRNWIQTATNAGVKAFGYRFTEPLSVVPPYLGGSSHFTIAMPADVDFLIQSLIALKFHLCTVV